MTDARSGEAGSASASADVEEGFLNVGPGPLHYVFSRASPGSVGAAHPPLVFLHEGLGSVGLWRTFPNDLRELTGAPTTLVYSRHGYGRSMPVKDARTPDYMHREARETLPAVIEAFGLSEPVLVGHSDGASIAIIHAGGGFAVHSLVLIAPHAFVEACTIQAIAEARRSYETTDLAARLARHHDDAESTFRGWNDVWLSDAFRAWNITDCLPAITAPTLLVQGSADAYGTLRQLDAIEAGVSGHCERVVLPDVGHAPHLEAPESCRTVVARFLEEGCASAE